MYRIPRKLLSAPTLIVVSLLVILGLGWYMTIKEFQKVENYNYLRDIGKHSDSVNVDNVLNSDVDSFSLRKLSTNLDEKSTHVKNLNEVANSFDFTTVRDRNTNSKRSSHLVGSEHLHDAQITHAKVISSSAKETAPLLSSSLVTNSPFTAQTKPVAMYNYFNDSNVTTAKNSEHLLDAQITHPKADKTVSSSAKETTPITNTLDYTNVFDSSQNKPIEDHVASQHLSFAVASVNDKDKIVSEYLVVAEKTHTKVTTAVSDYVNVFSSTKNEAGKNRANSQYLNTANATNANNLRDNLQLVSSKQLPDATMVFEKSTKIIPSSAKENTPLMNTLNYTNEFGTDQDHVTTKQLNESYVTATENLKEKLHVISSQHILEVHANLTAAFSGLLNSTETEDGLDYSTSKHFNESYEQDQKSGISKDFFDDLIDKEFVTKENDLTEKSNATKNIIESSQLVLDTPGCKIPSFDPWDESIIDLFQPRYEEYDCGGNKNFLIANANASITVNETALELFYNMTVEDLNCTYTAIERISPEETNTTNEDDVMITDHYVLNFGEPIPDSFIGVSCNVFNDTENIFEHYFGLVHGDEANQRQRNEALQKQKQKLDIILVGIDSISKLNFLRHFNRTHNFMKEKTSAFEMNGYTKVGDNTFPNLVALLTGQRVETYYNESLSNETYFDHLDFIWKEYAKNGYKTFFAEDYPTAGTFNFYKKGFINPPTDFYFRPLAIAIGFAKHRFWTVGWCLNSETDANMIYKYKKLFLEVMKDEPVFAFSMVSTMTHDNFNHAGYQDFDTVQLMEELQASGALNKSMLVVFSDHGLRFGDIRERYIGKFEERLPFMFINFPDWFLEQQPEIAKNLKTNQDRLVTLFDVHATMLHLLDLDNPFPPEDNSTLGTSLFTEISPDRTCFDANIDDHYCACQTFKKVFINKEPVIHAGQALIDYMNSMLKDYSGVCGFLEVDSISDARVGQMDRNLMKFQYYEFVNNKVEQAVEHKGRIAPIVDYWITLTAKPGGGLFEGTVRHSVANEAYQVLGISRINMYGNQSHCITSPKLKLYCYCIDLE